MAQIWKALVGIWSFIADTAQVLGVDWKAVSALVLTTGGGTWVIGFVTGVGPFQLAIGVAATMFFVAGASAFSRYRKLPTPSIPESAPSSDLGGKLTRARERAIAAAKPFAPRYAPPPNHTYESMANLSNAVLGEYLAIAGAQIEKYLRDIRYSLDNVRVSREFMEIHGPIFFGLYEEARRRGYTNNTLDTFFEYPDNIHNRENITWIGNELQKFGAQVKIRAKPQ